MSKDLQSVSLLDILPPNLLADKQINAAVQALDDELQKITAATKEALLLPRLDELPEAVIDLLAWQWHVDFYEPAGMDIETKRKLIKTSIAWHRIKGTKAAVEAMVQIISGKNLVTEWFEYGGEPYHFRIDLWDAPRTDPENTANMVRGIDGSKNIRSWLDEIRVHRDTQNTIYIGVAPSIHTICEVCQELVRDEAVQVQRRIGAVLSVHNVYAVAQT